MRVVSSFFLILLFIGPSFVGTAFGQTKASSPKTAPIEMTEPVGNPRLVRQIRFGNYGGRVLRYGDLNGDGRPDVLVVQADRQEPTCLTAIDLTGRKLWQIGTPTPPRFTLGADLPVQIYDWNGDGRNEVLVVRQGKLQILRGRDGKVLRQRKVPGSDSLFIGNFFSDGSNPGLVVKNRYKQAWIYDRWLKRRWTARLKTGHFPFAFDQDGDGVDEVLLGYSLFRGDGSRVWDLPLTRHNDAVDSSDLNGDGKVELGIATSGRGVLVSKEGQILWSQPHGHSQHVVMGAFGTEAGPSRQVIFVDRKSNGTVHAYDYSGRELWHLPSQGSITMASAVDGWTGKREESFLLLFRRHGGPPVLVNGSGRQVAAFPFPPAEGKKKFRKHFVQHFDLMGDGREEILINDHRELWIYENAAPLDGPVEISEGLPNPRIYNASFYIGMQ